MADEDQRGPGPRESTTARTSRQVAFTLIALFGALLIGTFVASVFLDTTRASQFVEMFKSGFLLLGGAVTTIIGYYFGSRRTQQAQSAAVHAVREASAAKAEAEMQRRKADELRADLNAPTRDESSLEPADEFLGEAP